MMHKPAELTDIELDTFLDETQLPVLVDLWAPWCVPCRALSPIIDKLARNTASNLLVAKINVEKYPSIMQRFGVRGIPTLLLFHNNNEPVRLVGAQSLSQLNDWLSSNQVNVSAPPVKVQQVEDLKWGSFYDDDELLAFIAARALRHASAGDITSAQSRYWLDGKGTLSAVMVHQAGSHEFERITGLPIAIGCLLDRCEYLTEGQVNSLFQALSAGKDYRLVPHKFMLWWLSEEFFSWDNHLQAPELIALLADWRTLCTDKFAGHEAPHQDFADIGSRAGSMIPSYEGPDWRLESIIAKLLKHLAPMPVTTNDELWSDISKNINWAHYHIMQIQSGWSNEDRSTPEHRMNWFMEKERQTPTGKLSSDEITHLREEWQSLNAEFISKENAFHQNLERFALPISHKQQMVLNQLFAEAPDF